MHDGPLCRLYNMKKTFTTRMPDRVGAFYLASRRITDLGLNITRVSYNTAVDTQTLFLEVEGEPDVLVRAEQALRDLGYLNDDISIGHVMLMEFMRRMRVHIRTALMWAGQQALAVRSV